MHVVKSTILAIMLFAAAAIQAAPAPEAPRPVPGKPFFTPDECKAAGNFPLKSYCLTAAGYLKAPPKRPDPKPAKPPPPKCFPQGGPCISSSPCCPGLTCRKVNNSSLQMCSK